MSYLIRWPAVEPPVATPSTPVLLCLPQAGTGAGRFRGWQERLTPRATVLGVQLPGREERWADPPPRDLDEIVSVVVGELRLAVDPDRPLVVFGDSFGGLIGYQLARVLDPSALVVCACRPPEYWARSGGISEQDIEHLVSAAMSDPQLPAGLDAEVRELAAESLRRDALLSATFRLRPDPALRCPVHAWGGLHDGMVSGEQLDDWRAATTAACHRHDFAGGHRVSVEEAESVLARLARVLDEAAAALTPPRPQPRCRPHSMGIRA